METWVAPGVLSQNFYKQQAEAGLGTPDWGGLLPFLRDWAAKGGRGIQGGDYVRNEAYDPRYNASYEQVLMDLANRGYDVAGAGLPGQAYAGPTASQMAGLSAPEANVYATRRSNARTGYETLLAQLNQREALTTQDRDESLRRYDFEGQQQRGALPGSYVGRGIYNSGIWQHALGDWTAGRVRGTADIQNQYQRLLQDISAQRSAGAADMNANLAQVDAEEAARKAQLVADLKAQGLVS